MNLWLDIEPEELQRRGAESLKKTEVEALVDQLLGLLERATSSEGAADAD